ncbi:hypothetical protein H6G33_05265 [Calothrix sp. FACHB-1219]|nr:MULTISPECIES: hypothetical protein [unclassified Calothrix]MBD2203269.1 hypothetical protein [Calothrix sp. FACHB-168]MBD2216435.1 hypothetical protein [Calothrix sp. FACHB-1219]
MTYRIDFSSVAKAEADAAFLSLPQLSMIAHPNQAKSAIADALCCCQGIR